MHVINSKCPGYPKHHLTSGVEATTVPLGKGVAMSVGMVLPGRWLTDHFNRPSYQLLDYDVYALWSDGDFVEGIRGKAASLACHHHLPQLSWNYDKNYSTIVENTSLAYSNDVANRFIGCGWIITCVGDANDCTMIACAFNTFPDAKDCPTLNIIDSHIGYDYQHKQGRNAEDEGSLGVEEIRSTYRRSSHEKIHVRGYKVEGTITTPFDMTVLNDLDRFHLVMDTIDRVAVAGDKGVVLNRQLQEKLIEHKRYINKNGQEMPEIRNWTWRS